MHDFLNLLLYTPVYPLIAAWFYSISPTIASWVVDGLWGMLKHNNLFSMTCGLIFSILEYDGPMMDIGQAFLSMYEIGMHALLSCLLDAAVFAVCVYMMKVIFQRRPHFGPNFVPQLHTPFISRVPYWMLDGVGVIIAAALMSFREDGTTIFVEVLSAVLPIVLLLIGITILLRVGGRDSDILPRSWGQTLTRAALGILPNVISAECAVIMCTCFILIISRTLVVTQMLVASLIFIAAFAIDMVMGLIIPVRRRF